MSGYILRDEERSVSLPAQRLDKLIARADSDAALLYLFLQRTDGGVTPQEIQKRLRWTELRFASAELTLRQLGLLEGETAMQPERAEEHPVYTAQEIADLLEGSAGFSALVRQAEEKLGKKLKTADLQILAGLFDDLALPPDVIYLLLCHCISRTERRFGPGRRPTMRQVEKEGYYWASQGLFDQESAARYLARYEERRQKMGEYLQVLQIQGRQCVESEEKTIAGWIEKGFSPELVAKAYDQTVFYKKELNWSYLNGILRSWAEKGWRTPEDVERGKKDPDKTRQGKGRSKQETETDWMKKYL